MLRSHHHQNRAAASAKPQVFKFFLLVYGLSAPFWLISFLTKNTNLPLNIPIGDVVAAFTPLIAACWLTRRQQNWRKVRSLLARIGDFRKLSLARIAVIIGLPAFVYGVTYAVFYYLGYDIPSSFSVSVIGLALLLVFFYFGAIGEEVGYTAYITDPLVARYGTLRASLLIGFLWASWHIPSMIVQGRTIEWILWGCAGTIAVRYIYVLLYEKTARCVSAVILMHVAFNMGRAVFPAGDLLVSHEAVYYSVIIITAVLVGIISSATHARRLDNPR